MADSTNTQISAQLPHRKKRKIGDILSNNPYNTAGFHQSDRSSLLNLPKGVIQLIFLYAPKESLGNLIFSARKFRDIFDDLNSKTLDSIRLSYLNNPRGNFNRFNRLVNVMASVPKSTFSIQSEQDFKTKLYKTGGEVASIILEELFAFNAQQDLTRQPHFLVAGGSVIGALKDQDFSDIDIFFMEMGCNPSKSNKILRDTVLRAEKKLQGLDYVVLKNKSLLNIYGRTGKYLQFVFRRVSCTEDLLCFFDLDICRFGYDGQTLWSTLEGLRSIELGFNLVGVEHINKRRYFTRATKYFERYKQKTLFAFVHPLDYLLTFEEIRSYLEYDIPRIDASIEKDENTRYSYNGFSYACSNLEMESNEKVEWYNDPNNFNYKSISSHLNEHREEREWKPKKIESLLGYLKFSRTLEELFQRDLSFLFTEFYFESHLFEKYDIVKCYMSGKYFKLFRKLSCFYKSSLHPLRVDALDRREQFLPKELKFNNDQKLLKRDLTGHVCIVTGARIKIGYATALILLRYGATVIATSRFPADALKRFSVETDFREFKERLVLYPLNLKIFEEATTFVEWVKSNYKRVHILINNAAQTVRRPIRYYKDVIETEVEDMVLAKIRSDGLEETTSSALTQSKRDFLPNLPLDLQDIVPIHVTMLKGVKDPEIQRRRTSLNNLFSHLTDEDLSCSSSQFPDGVKDKYGEQIDRRTFHSWKYKPDEIPTSELFETQMINHLAPTTILNGLLDVLKPTSADLKTAYVINVTSIEGQFSIANKGENHIHTNMSKSALNMLTKSGGQFYAKNGILVNSVDTGWVSSAIDTWKVPPLERDDGAYRILHPILTQSTTFGKLWKNYRVVNW